MRRIQLMRMFEYRANFLFWAVVSLMWTAFNFLFFSLIVGITGNLGGWNHDQMFLLLGVFTLVDSILWSFFRGNMVKFTSDIYDGSFNMVLTKPIDAQFWLMIRENDYNNIFRAILGIAVMLQALAHLHLQPSPLQVISFLILLLASLTLIYATWFILSTFAFYVERLNNINEIIPNLERLYQVPHQIYKGIASTIFTVLIPLGLVSSVPSQALLGNASLFTSLYLIIFSICLIFISRAFFHISIKKYAGIAS